MKIKIALYKNSKSIFAKFIRFQQRRLQGLPQRNARFSHAEIVFDYAGGDKDVCERVSQIESVYFGKTNRDIVNKRKIFFEKFGLWFSSSERDGGTRFKFIEDHKKNWKYYEIEVTKEQYLKCLEYCMSQNKNSYGWLSIIFTQALRTLWFVDKKSPFCSQVVVQALQSIGMFCGENSIEVNPGKLSYMLENKYFKL